MSRQRNVPVDQREKKNAPSEDVRCQNSGSAALGFIFLVRPDECEILNCLTIPRCFCLDFRGNPAFWPFVCGPNWRGKSCPLEVCSLELHPLEICPSEIRPFEICFLELRPFEICFLELCPFEICLFEPRLLEPRPLELRHKEICFRQVDHRRMSWKFSQLCLLQIWSPISLIFTSFVFGCSEVRKSAQGRDHVTCAWGGIVCLGLMVWYERQGRLSIFFFLVCRLSSSVAHEAAEEILHLKIMAFRVGHGQLTQCVNSGFAYRQAVIGQHCGRFGKTVGILSLLSDENLLLCHGRTPDGQRQTDHSEPNKSEVAKAGDVIFITEMAFNVPASRGEKRPNLAAKAPKDQGKNQKDRDHEVPSAKTSGNRSHFRFGWIDSYQRKKSPTIRQFSFLLGQIIQSHRFAERCFSYIPPSLSFPSHINPFRGKTLQYSSFTSGCEGSAMTLLIDPSKKPTRYRSNEACVKHFCMAKGCSNWGAFGIGTSFKAGKPGQWFCSEHIAQAHKQLCSDTRKSSDIPDYLLPQPVRARKARRERNFKKQQGVLL